MHDRKLYLLQTNIQWSSNPTDYKQKVKNKFDIQMTQIMNEMFKVQYLYINPWLFFI